MSAQKNMTVSPIGLAEVVKRLLLIPTTVAVLLGVAACGPSIADKTSRPLAERSGFQSVNPNGGQQLNCDPSQGWSCNQQKRFVATHDYVKSQAGYLGVVMYDRKTGAVWDSGSPQRLVWMASTIKLAMATDLLAQDRKGAITLTASDRQLIADMLEWSSNDAATVLWEHYGGDEMMNRFRDKFGMSEITFVDGSPRNWGFIKCTTSDLATLMTYILNDAPKQDRTYLVDSMRSVAENQQWGVWAAGEERQPGNKDGWSLEIDDGQYNWITDTVGFAGKDERYVVAVMYQQLPDGTLPQGAQTVSDVVALLFGKPTPAQIIIPEPDD